MVSYVEACSDFVGAEHCSDRNAACKTFGECDDIRRDTVPLIAEHHACPADACLNLIDDEKDAVILTELVYELCIFDVCRVYAALALNEFEHDCCSLGSAGFPERIEIIERNILESGHYGSKRLTELGLAGSGDRAQCPSVEAVLGRDDLVSVFVPVVEISACDLDGCLVGLSA